MDFSLEAQDRHPGIPEGGENLGVAPADPRMFARLRHWTRRSHWSIKGYLTVLVVATLIPAAAVIVYDVVHAANDELARAERENSRLATRIAESIEQYFTDTERLLSRIAKRRSVLAMDAQKCDPILADDALLLDAYSNIALRDPLGKLVCSFLPATLTVPQAEAGQITSEAAHESKFKVTDGMFSAVADEWVVFANHPIVNDHGLVIGVISARIDLDRLQSRVIHTVAPNRVVSVLDRNGKFVMRSVDREGWIGRAIELKSLQRVPNGQTRIVRAKGVDGEARLYGLHRLSRPDWVVFAGTKEADIFAPYHRHLMRGLAIASVALFLAVVIARRIGKQLISPALRLRETARLITEGDASARAREEGPTEMRFVARAINRMLDEGARAQAKILESDRRMRETFDTVDLIAVVVDEQGSIRYCNEYFLRLTGWKAQDVEGRNWFDFFVPSDLVEPIKERYFSMIAGGAVSLHAENEILTRTGERRLIQWNNTFFRSVKTATPIGMSSVGEDITERVAAAARVQRLTAFYAALSRTNAALIRMDDPASLYREITSICVSFGHAKIAYISLITEDRLQPVAWAGPSEEIVKNLYLPLQPAEARSLSARAAVEGCTKVSNDFLSDPQTLGLERTGVAVWNKGHGIDSI